MRKRKGYNPKRRLADADHWSQEKRKAMADKARYGGNSEHKTKPNNFGLKPPVNPRPGKTLCDGNQEFAKSQAEALLRGGLLRGMISLQKYNGWPQNVWAVLDGEPFEGQLENRDQGIYHGYPMPADDDFRITILKEWSSRER